ncbi:TetR family transcriptional regulator [Kribbella antiqua]|uniref:TetR family transcriptional regulator n=1 Tax=Kribbella antiqua TaxID=2512217 RepID=A0A4R2IV91_9ACTN|nr:TetR/AcrR family transcriptional regulator [Kribbella antiqua]TCO48296.1 TetR family transcriptional regulator [Kribbella antiqua]
MLKKPAANWREARRENARAAVLTAAWELARADGLAALSLRELARRAGITTPTVYAYFESKNAILDAMFAQAAQEFVELKASLPQTDDPEQDLLREARAFVTFCVSDVPRYQLLFQHAVPGFTPSAESYELAVKALDVTRELLARNGVHDPRHLDILTAVTTGLVDQQISNDPGGDRWTRLVEDVVRMLLAQFASEKAQ